MGCPARKPLMSSPEPGNEIQLETTASTTMNAKVSQVRFRNLRSPKQRGAFVLLHAGRHNPARIHDGAQYRIRRAEEPTRRTWFEPVPTVLRRARTDHQDEATALACWAHSSIVSRKRFDSSSLQ